MRHAIMAMLLVLGFMCTLHGPKMVAFGLAMWVTAFIIELRYAKWKS